VLSGPLCGVANDNFSHLRQPPMNDLKEERTSLQRSSSPAGSAQAWEGCTWQLIQSLPEA
jgi:hypothetical protein